MYLTEFSMSGILVTVCVCENITTYTVLQREVQLVRVYRCLKALSLNAIHNT